MGETGRRRLGRMVAGSLAAALGAGGCAAVSPGRGARPLVSHGVVTLSFSPWTAGGTWTATVQRLLASGIAPFEAANRGLRVRLVPPPGGCCNPAALTAALVAGTAPDIVLNNNIGGYASGGYLLPLTTYLRRDNIDLRLWSPAQIASFRDWNNRDLLALPTYYNTTAYLVNLTVMDQLGMGYPDPAWTSGDFARLARSLSGTQGGGRRFGCNLWFSESQAWGVDWIFRAFGGRKVLHGGAACGLSEAASVAAGDWLYHEFLWPQVGTTKAASGGALAQFASGRTVLSVQQAGGLLATVTQLAGTTMKWDIAPFPVFPAGRACFGGDQYYAISALTRHPDQAWELLRWLSAETSWQLSVMRIFLMAPALLSLWPQWIRLIQALAPPLRHKNVQWFGHAAMHGYAYPTSYFRYVDASAEAILQGAFTALGQRRTTVRQAFVAAARQVDALERSNAGAAAPGLRSLRSSERRARTRVKRMFAVASARP